MDMDERVDVSMDVIVNSHPYTDPYFMRISQMHDSHLSVLFLSKTLRLFLFPTFAQQ